MKRLFWVSGLVLLCGAIAHAAEGAGTGKKPEVKSFKGFAANTEQPVTAELIAEHASVQPGSETRIGVHFDMKEGWHIYGREPGDAGLPTKIAWTVPPGFKTGPLQWPPAQEFTDAGNIRTFGYSGAVVLASTLKYVASRESLIEAPIHAHVEWLACKDICLPGSADLDLTLPVTSQPPARSARAELFDQIPE